LAMLSFDAKSAVITPIVILRSGRLVEPVLYTRAGDDNVVDRFVRLHYADGTRFDVRQAGEAKGSVRIDHFEPGCDAEFAFVVKPLSATALDNKRPGLAFNGQLGPVHPNFQMRANMDEHSAFIDQNRKYLAIYGHTITDHASIKVHDLVATKTSSSGHPLLVGSISFTQNKTEYWLFSIIEENAGEWRTAIAEVHTIKDLEDYKDAQEENFLDQLDVDGDGVDEIFSNSTYYEAGSFAIYGVRNGTWKQVYASHVAGC
jgi:hypothetical protein